MATTDRFSLHPNRHRLVLAGCLVVLALLSLGGSCSTGDPPPPPPPPDPPPAAGVGPNVSLTLDGVSATLQNLLVVPPSGFVINVSWQAVDAPVNTDSLFVAVQPLSGKGFTLLTGSLIQTVHGAAGIVSGWRALAPGSYLLQVYLQDTLGNDSGAILPFAVRNFATAPPIGHGLQIWYDFESDRDSEPGSDFAADLPYFGLASAVAPTLATQMKQTVIGALLDRIALAYHADDPAGLGMLDPVAVTFTSVDPGPGPGPGPSEVTRICVGGADPSGRGAIGDIAIDPGNAQRSSIECGTLPATGIFPRELLVFASAAGFQSRFDGLRPATGGTPVGEDPLDAIVLDPAFDAASATTAQLDRSQQIQDAVDAFAGALGSIMAHETGHAFGLVPPGPPGGGLYGGSTGPEFSHNVMPDGSAPTESFLMNAGNTFSFSELAGLDGFALPRFRPLNYAYLRDRVVLDARVSAILPAPTLDSVTPTHLTDPLATLGIYGSNFVDTPSVRLVNANWSFDVVGETWLWEGAIQATAIKSQIYPGVYDLELTNPDGQVALLPGAVDVQP